MCIDRLKNNESPACSLVCPTGCIFWGDTQRGLSERLEQGILPEGTAS
jgi:Fe-S-cluster-containing dehydrogenase component